MPERLSKIPAPAVRAWKPLLALTRSREHLSIPDPELTLLAALLAVAGPPGEDPSRELFWTFKGLLLQRRRLLRLKKALQIIPPYRDTLLHLTRVAQAYGNQVGPLKDGRVQVDRVIKVMLEIPNPEEYVRQLKRSGFNHLGGIFHPNTLERARREMRGLFSGTKGKDGYWEKTSNQLNIIED